MADYNLKAVFEADVKDFMAGTKSVLAQLTKVAAGYVSVKAAATALVGAVKTVATFERANASLASVLGTSVAGVKELSEAAKELGRTTEFTATNVTELQVALARLGFTTKEISNMQEPILKFASAVGTDLGSAADFTGSALRAFGLTSQDTTRLLDVMSAATSKSALDFSKLQTSISVVAPIAKAFGLTVTETASFLGVLANNGFDASSAATALRNILLNLSDANGKLATGIGHSARNFEEIIRSFRELTDKGIDVNDVLKMTDRRAAAAAQTLITNAEAADTLNEALKGADGTLNDMYNTMTDNVIGAVNNLKSAWEGLQLTIEESEGPIKNVINRLARGVNAWTDLIKGTPGKTLAEAAAPGIVEWMQSQAKHSYQEYQELIDYYASLGSFYDRERMAMEAAKKLKFGEDVDLIGPVYNPVSTFFDSGAGSSSETEAEMDKAAARAAERARENAERIAKVAAEAQMDERTRLRAHYEEELAILEKYGLDTAALTQNYLDALAKIEINENNEVAEALAEEAAMMDEAGDKLLEDFEKINGLNLDPVKNEIRELAGIAEATLESTEATVKRGEELAERFNSAVAEGISAGCQEMMNQLFGLQEVNGGAILNALLSPLADLAIKEGEILVASGAGIEAIKTALESLNGVAAIAAGVALMALGTAAKAGLSALGRNAGSSYSASASVASASYGSTAAMGGGYASSSLSLNITGKLTADGRDLSIVLNNENVRKRTVT